MAPKAPKQHLPPPLGSEVEFSVKTTRTPQPTSQQPQPAAAATSKEKSTDIKRGRVNGVDGDLKHVKRSKNKEPVPKDSKKALSQRRQWAKEDDVVILQGIIDFFAAEGKAPSQDMKAFHDFIKESLHFELTVNQLSEEIDIFMEKFHNQVKGKEGEGKVFQKSHYQTIFNLSKQIWGVDSVMYVRDRMQIERTIEKNYKFDSSANLKKKIDYALINGLKFADGRKKAELKEKLRKLQALEWLLCKKQLELVAEIAELMEEALDPDVLSLFQ